MFNFFRRLQWKLTLSYAFVTVGTVIVLTTLMVAIAMYFDTQNTSRTFDSFYWSKTAFQDNIPYLLDDPEALQAWLERVQSTGFTWSDFQSNVVRETLDYANSLVIISAPIYVLDPDLNVLATAPLENPDMIGKPFKPRTANNGANLGLAQEAILEAALTGDKNYYSQSTLRPDGTRLAAFPLRKSDEDPVVAIVVYALKPSGFPTPTNLELYQTFFLMMMLVMLLVALPVGALFGWLVTRRLRRRLVGLSAASQAWSQGDFSVAPRDNSGDEIGELTRNLNGMTEKLQSLIQTKDELARLEERNRLARDLHDTVKQQTYAARMQLTAAKNLLSANPVAADTAAPAAAPATSAAAPAAASAAAAHIDAALQLNRETQQELKLIIDELRPAALQGKGLAQAVKEYAARWQEHTGIAVELNVSGDRSLPLSVEQALYRVLQEALANVARHAEADKVILSLAILPERAILGIADNGRGFDAAGVPASSYGLTSMRARLSEVGGALSIASTPSAGTTLTAEVKLN